jgi:hypothetical protein
VSRAGSGERQADSSDMRTGIRAGQKGRPSPAVKPFSNESVRRVWTRLAPYFLPSWFLILAVDQVNGFIRGGFVGIDARIYQEAARVALAGGNPYTAQVNGYLFAATPPTVLVFVPTSGLPDAVAVAFWMALCAVAMFWIVYVLRLPWWWVLFPPFVNGVLSGNPDPVVLAVLLMPAGVAAFAPILKIYGAIPLLGARRWRALGLAALLALPSIPLWGYFLRDRDAISLVLQTQSHGGLSAWGTPLLGPTLAALAIMRGRGARWLVVPAVWPFTQFHYNVLAVPAIRHSTIASAIIAIPTPMSAPVSVGYLAAKALIDRRPSPLSQNQQ